MKKIFVLALALLMLCGCGAEPPAPTTAETQPTEVLDTAEVLKTYDLPYEANCAAPMGDDILLLTDDGTTAVKIDGKKIEEKASAALGLTVDLQDPAVRVNENGMCYYDAGSVIFLDGDLQEISRISLPDDAIGLPAVSSDMQTVYYVTANAIRAIDRTSGLSRLLREISFPNLTISGLHLNDTIIECLVRDEASNASILFFSAETGKLCDEYSDDLSLRSDVDFWFASIGGGYSQILFGTGAEDIQALMPAKDYTDAALIPGMKGVLTTTEDETATVLRFYDLETGFCTAALALDNGTSLRSVWGDPDKNCIWFLPNGSQLCCWDLDESAAQEAVSCIGPYYTRENPDTEGLAALESTVQELESSFGVQIHIGEDAVVNQPGEYTLVSEFQVDALKNGLDSLSTALARFTPEFLANVGKASDDGVIHISLVRSVNGSAAAGSLQFWDADGNACIALTAGNSVEQNFYHEVAHIINTRVMSECNAYDNWENLNPKGFEYTYDDLTTPQWDDSIHAGAFIDSAALTFPTEDRARIFEYAMMDGNESCFESEIIQKKLSTLCTGIRRAFGLKDSEETFPWEQYLAE